jgi:protein O-GlcNAc transferase
LRVVPTAWHPHGDADSQPQPTADSQLAEADGFYRSGDLESAANIFSLLVEANTANVVPYYMLGVIRARQGRYHEALPSIENALILCPGHPVILASQANVLSALGRCDEALACCARALQANPFSPEALIAQGTVLFSLGRHEEAILSYDSALARHPDLAVAWNNRALALHRLMRFDEALDACDRALAVEPRYVEALNNRGNSSLALHHHFDALEAYDRALAIDPRSFDTLCGKGRVLFDLNKLDEALKCLDKALAIRTNAAGAWNNRGITLQHLGRAADALSSYEQALALDDKDPKALEGAVIAALCLCDWRLSEALAVRVMACVNSGVPVSPFCLLGITDDNASHLRCARNFTQFQFPALASPKRTTERHHHDRLRVAYLSGDFIEHPVALQIAQLLECHDRSRFEIYGISSGPGDESAIRARIAGACNHFVDVSRLDDVAAARLLRELEIDILVDLNGHSGASRLGVLSYRPCPIQISWLGYPGTLGARFVDYFIADEIALPVENRQYFSEEILYLPECFFPTDSGRPMASGFSRRDMGLPDEGFVFCCFNASWKVSPQVYEVWMGLLRAIPGSVLWLRGDGSDVAGNLRREAAARGVDPHRLIFAKRVPIDIHLGRHALADLFLDTVPYNAHATASDALWAGLPVLTCKTSAFPGRVGASLLNAIGLPELIADNMQSYERIALQLASEPDRLAALRGKLRLNRETYPLFDTGRLCRNIESAFFKLVGRPG